MLRVSVAASLAREPAMLGTYAVTADALRFTPRFPLDPGRRYTVTLDPSQLPGRGMSPVVTASVARPAAAAGPPASVLNVYPSGGVLPENQLRMYVQFSAPMGRHGGIGHVRILDEQGREIQDPFLPLDTELWSHDATRFTVLFDPGRVKRGILPNVEDVAAWRIERPASGSRDPLGVIFPKPLDHGLLHSALGVARDGRAVAGDITVEAGETRWLFTPRGAWRAGPHALVVLTTLEDPAGNGIGRAFEVPGGGPELGQPESVTLPFDVRD